MADRTWNPIDSRLYEEEWSNTAKLVAGVLLARCPNQYGVFDFPWWFIKTLFHGLINRGEIEFALVELETAGFIRMYRDNNVIWIIKKWKRSGNPSKKHWIGLHNVLADYPEVQEDILSYYEGVFNPIESPLNPHSNPESESESDTDSDNKKRNTKASKPTVYDASIIDFCREIVLLKCSTTAQLNIQCKALRSLLSDLKKFYPSGQVDTKSWQEEVYAVLRWARSDTIPGSSGFCWNTVFQSMPPLRKNGLEKFINMRAAFLKSRPGYKYRQAKKSGIRMDDKRRAETDAFLRIIEGDEHG